jgi:putative tricarboxylic transport membrane protein
VTTAITPLGRLRATLPYVVVLAAGLHLFYLADGFEFEQSSGRIGPGAWPQIILVLMIVTALWGIVSSARRAVADVPELVAEEDEALIQPPEIYPWLVWLAVAMTLIYLFVLPIFGFFLTTAIYSFVLMYIGHYRKPASAAVLSLAIALSFMFIFMRVVYVALPLGIAPFIDVSYALMAAMGVR